MLVTNEDKLKHKENNKMKKLGMKIITKATVIAAAASLMIGGTQVFAAERISDGDTVNVDLDGYTTKTNYTFVPESTGDYNFSASESDNSRMTPSVRIYRGSTLIGEFGIDYTISLESGVSYQIQARGTGLRRGQEGSYSLSITRIAPPVFPEDVAPDYGMEDIFDEVITDPQIDDAEDNTVIENADDHIVIVDNTIPAAVITPSVPDAAPSIAAPAAASVAAPAASREAMAEGFVNRLYTTVLNRQPDQAGKTFWVNELIAGQVSGSKVAEGFINSQEFINRDLDDEDFIETLYVVFFNRIPSEAEVDNWENALDNGASRTQVFDSFAASSEWSNTCSGFGINK